jgi:hypothetical protein
MKSKLVFLIFSTLTFVSCGSNPTSFAAPEEAPNAESQESPSSIAALAQKYPEFAAHVKELHREAELSNPEITKGLKATGKSWADIDNGGVLNIYSSGDFAFWEAKQLQSQAVYGTVRGDTYFINTFMQGSVNAEARTAMDCYGIGEFVRSKTTYLGTVLYSPATTGPASSDRKTVSSPVGALISARTSVLNYGSGAYLAYSTHSSTCNGIGKVQSTSATFYR